jgi:hypothetical protein
VLKQLTKNKKLKNIVGEFLKLSMNSKRPIFSSSESPDPHPPPFEDTGIMNISPIKTPHISCTESDLHFLRDQKPPKARPISEFLDNLGSKINKSMQKGEKKTTSQSNLGVPNLE